VAALLTGMGADGAAGMLGLRKAGAITLAQDEASCVVYGMPKEAVRLGGVQQVVALPDMPKAIEHHCRTIQTRGPGQFQAQQPQSAL
jgi:two-component system chemotaxis response regulator CheB